MRRTIRSPLRRVDLIAAIVVAIGAIDAGAAPAAAVVEQPRPFGYVIGDVVTQRVLLEIEGRAVDPAALPKAERVGVWLERRPARIESRPDGHRWLAVEYQLINAPQALTTVNLPSFELQGLSAEIALQVAEWPISVNVLTPPTAFRAGGLDELRPDRAAPTMATEPIRRQVVVWSGAFLLTLAVWLAWVVWRNWRAATARPFARALHDMRRLDETAPEAWQALHRAFDETAGRVIQIATLPTLFDRAPHLEALRSQIERFYAQSGELFFGCGSPADRLSTRALCAQLRRIEKRHER
jgi:mxaA protein